MAKKKSEQIKIHTSYGHKQDKSWIWIEIQNTGLDFQNPAHRKIMDASIAAIGPTLYKFVNCPDHELSFEDGQDNSLDKILSEARISRNDIEDISE